MIGVVSQFVGAWLSPICINPAAIHLDPNIVTSTILHWGFLCFCLFSAGLFSDSRFLWKLRTRKRGNCADKQRERFFSETKSKMFFCQFGDDRTIATGNDWGCEPICWCLIVTNLHQPCCHSPRSKYCHFHYSSLRFSLFLFSAGVFSNHFYIWKQPHFFW